MAEGSWLCREMDGPPFLDKTSCCSTKGRARRDAGVKRLVFNSGIQPIVYIPQYIQVWRSPIAEAMGPTLLINVMEDTMSLSMN